MIDVVYCDDVPGIDDIEEARADFLLAVACGDHWLELDRLYSRWMNSYVSTL